MHLAEPGPTSLFVSADYNYLFKPMKHNRTKPALINDMRPTTNQAVKQEGFYAGLIKRITRNLKLIIIVLLVVFLVAVVATWWVTTGHKTKEQRDLNTVKSQVSKHMLLPKDEEPTLAEVTDKNQIKDKFLAKNASNGDQVLIYTTNQIAIIYRPSADRIVAVGSVTADPALAEAKNATLTILNGSKNPEKTKAIIAKIKAAYPDITVTDGGITNKHDFPTTIVIDSSNQKDYLTDALARVSGGRRGVVPISEARADTDLMIIVGAN
jgi:cell division protein FtsL